MATNGQSSTKLLVSVRGPIEAVEAAKGGAHIADVEYPASALGTPYPLNILAVRERLDQEEFRHIPISTNIGEDQPNRSTACQAALGVAQAGTDFVKCGLAGLGLKAAVYLGDSLVRTVKKWHPNSKVYPAVFPEEEFAEIFDPIEDSPELVERTNADGVLIDTYRKDIGMGLLDYYGPDELSNFVGEMHEIGKEAWLAGSISIDELSDVVQTGADVICVRGAACEKKINGNVRFGEITENSVNELIQRL